MSVRDPQGDGPTTPIKSTPIVVASSVTVTLSNPITTVRLRHRKKEL